MYLLLVKTECQGDVCYTTDDLSITIIELFKKYQKWKENTILQELGLKVLGYIIIDLATDEIVEKYYEPKVN